MEGMIDIINKTKSKLKRSLIVRVVGFLSKELGKNRISVVFVGSSKMRALNSKFRKKNYATDILSFPFDDLEVEGLGELVICLPTIKKQAKKHGLSVDEELVYMIIHGYLHLLGYDHEKSERQAKLMFRLQDRLFEKFLKRLK